MSDFVIIREITIGNILTFISIGVSALALLYVWSKERHDRNKAKNDKVKTAAAKALAKLERWEELSLWYYEDIQPALVVTSEILKKNPNTDEARDYLWKMLNVSRKNITKRILEEEIEMAYVELYAYYPSIHTQFTETIKELKDIDIKAFDNLKKITQKDIENFKTFPRDEYKTSLLGNALRQSCVHNHNMFQKQIDKKISPIRDNLNVLILGYGEGILSKISRKVRNTLSKPSELFKVNN